jgi:hypothetical protein
VLIVSLQQRVLGQRLRHDVRADRRLHERLFRQRLHHVLRRRNVHGELLGRRLRGLMSCPRDVLDAVFRRRVPARVRVRSHLHADVGRRRGHAAVRSRSDVHAQLHARQLHLHRGGLQVDTAARPNVQLRLRARRP